MKVVMTGATGFIGREVTRHLLNEGHELTAMVRDARSASTLKTKTVEVNLNDGDVEATAKLLQGTDAVVHLAGEPIMERRWTHEAKQGFWSSRVHTTRNLVNSIASLPANLKPKVLISGSAIGFYGDRGEENIAETTGSGSDFLSQLSQSWETEALRAESLGLRVVLLRTAIVLGKDGGALKKMLPIILGTGAQWMSWIHLQDIARFVVFSLSASQVKGPYNLAAPGALRNQEFVKRLAQVKRCRLTPRVPTWILRVFLGEMSNALLSSCRASPERAMQAGFSFLYPTVQEALNEIFSLRK